MAYKRVKSLNVKTKQVRAVKRLTKPATGTTPDPPPTTGWIYPRGTT